MRTITAGPGRTILSAAVILWSGAAGLAENSTDPNRFKLQRGFLIVVQASMSGAQLDLLLDTGSARTILDERVVRHIGSDRSNTRIRAFGKSLAAERVELPELSWMGTTSERITVLSTDLGGFRRRTGVRVDGVLGLDLLRGHCLGIDYRSKRTDLTCNGSASPSTTVQLEEADGLIAATVRLGPHSLRLIVDTGADSIVLFRSSVPFTRHPASDWTTAAGAADDLPVRMIIPDLLLVGPARLVRTQVLLADAPPLGASLDGLLGVTSLGASRVRLDLKGMTLSW
jgi:predicted aspartyl protease